MRFSPSSARRPAESRSSPSRFSTYPQQRVGEVFLLQPTGYRRVVSADFYRGAELFIANNRVPYCPYVPYCPITEGE